MTGFDFSLNAIEAAGDRSKTAGVESKTKFLLQDATTAWSFPSETFDLAIDCFATTDIESKEKREFAVSEMKRVVKMHGYILVYVMSTEDKFHKELIKKSPAFEKNAFLHPATGKFEKVYDRKELTELYSGLNLIAEERVPKTATFFGKKYSSNHHWMVFEK